MQAHGRQLHPEERCVLLPQHTHTRDSSCRPLLYCSLSWNSRISTNAGRINQVSVLIGTPLSAPWLPAKKQRVDQAQESLRSSFSPLPPKKKDEDCSQHQSDKVRIPRDPR